MSLFDSLASSFGQPSGQGQSGGLIGAALNFVNNQPGGLLGLIQRFRDGGAGAIVDSWIGTGENKAISPDLLGSILGSSTVSDLAQKAGVAPELLTSMLASVLPSMVDKATPNGELPANNQLEASHVMGALGDLAGLFGKK